MSFIAEGFEFAVVLLVISLITFALYAYDKVSAVKGKERIPEFLLLGAAALLGAIGAICAMFIFKHKTAKPRFCIGVPVMLILQIMGMAFYNTHY